jgi:lipopolysaccharide export LptBFGC system permease protein LptF
MASTLPGFDRIHTLVLPYYIILPGYVISLVLRQGKGITQTVFFSLVWSVVILGSIFSLTTLAPNLSAIPLSIVIPIITVALTAYAYYHKR